MLIKVDLFNVLLFSGANDICYLIGISGINDGQTGTVCCQWLSLGLTDLLD